MTGDSFVLLGKTHSCVVSVSADQFSRQICGLTIYEGKFDFINSQGVIGFAIVPEEQEYQLIISRPGGVDDTNKTFKTKADVVQKMIEILKEKEYEFDQRQRKEISDKLNKQLPDIDNSHRPRFSF